MRLQVYKRSMMQNLLSRRHGDTEIKVFEKISSALYQAVLMLRDICVVKMNSSVPPCLRERFENLYHFNLNLFYP